MARSRACWAQCHMGASSAHRLRLMVIFVSFSCVLDWYIKHPAALPPSSYVITLTFQSNCGRQTEADCSSCWIHLPFILHSDEYFRHIFHMLHVCTSARWSYAESTILIYVISISHRAPCGEYCKGLRFKRVDGGILFIFHHRHLRLQIPEKYARNELARAVLCLHRISYWAESATQQRSGGEKFRTTSEQKIINYFANIYIIGGIYTGQFGPLRVRNFISHWIFIYNFSYKHSINSPSRSVAAYKWLVCDIYASPIYHAYQHLHTKFFVRTIKCMSFD